MSQQPQSGDSDGEEGIPHDLLMHYSGRGFLDIELYDQDTDGEEVLVSTIPEEDDRDTLNLSRLLREEGYRVIEVDDVEDGKSTDDV